MQQLQTSDAIKSFRSRVIAASKYGDYVAHFSNLLPPSPPFLSLILEAVRVKITLSSRSVSSSSLSARDLTANQEKPLEKAALLGIKRKRWMRPRKDLWATEMKEQEVFFGCVEAVSVCAFSEHIREANEWLQLLSRTLGDIKRG
jgi:hypothetical protein